MSEKFEAIIGYIERLAACTALAAGGVLIIHYAPKLMFGPWVPRIVGGLLFLFAFFLVVTANTNLAILLSADDKHRLRAATLAGVIAAGLQLVCMYFIIAGVMAATSTLAP